MRNQFAVRYESGNGRIARVMFEGNDTGDIYAWLKKNSALDAPGFKVVDRLTLVEWEEGDFIREFEEQMAKANAATGEHKCLSEDDVRRIFREELTKALESVRETAQDRAFGLAGYEVGDLERIAYGALLKLVESEKDKL